MRVNFSKLLDKSPVAQTKVRYKKVAVATYAELFSAYQQKARTTGDDGEDTTHLTSIFERATNLLEMKAKPAFVLSGKFPEIKRHQRITNETAKPRQTSNISAEMILEVRHLLELMGLPIIQAPTEEEAQAAHMCQKDDVWAVVSRGWDSLIYGSPRVLLKASTAKMKKQGSKVILQGAELIEQKRVLKELKLDADQLIILGMLLGTKFNPAIVDLSQKQALHLVHKWKDSGKLFKYAGWNYAYTWKEVYDCIKTLPVTNKYRLKWGKIKEDKLVDLLTRKGLGERKVKNALEKIR